MRRERGFTIVELMVALTILLIGILGVVSILAVTFRASAYSRHATEATVIAEQKLEELRGSITLPADGSYDDGGTIDSRGVLDSAALFTRTWVVSTVNPTDANGNSVTLRQIEVTVAWNENGTSNQVLLRTERAP